MRRRFMLTSTAAILILAVSYATAALAGNPATPVLAQGSTVQNVNVTFDEWSISARQMAVRANQPVHFTLYNAGTESHRLSVGRGDDDAVSSPSSRPGQDPAVLDMTFDTPGVYQVWCPFETDGVQHRDLGMVATLTIVPEEDTPVVEVPISEGNYYIQSRAVSAVAGAPVRIELTNVGTSAHQLTIAGHGVTLESPLVLPDGSLNWDVQFDEPGTYEIYCNVNLSRGTDSHRGRGMTGLLEVFPGGASG